MAQGYDSIQLAHVAEALEDMDHSLGYDEAADKAASLLSRSAALRTVAARYVKGTVSGDELRAAVLQVVALVL